NLLISAGKTVEVNFDFQEIYRPWELPNSRLIPYFAGENVDINYALSLGLTRNIYQEMLNNPTAAANVSKFTFAEYKDYVMKFFDDYNIRIDAMPITKRAKELLRIELKSEEAYYLSMGDHWIEKAYRNVNGKGYRDPIPDFVKPQMDESYLDYPQLLGLDDVMMFYAHQFSYNITGWNMCFQQVFYKSRYLDEFNALYANTMENLPSTVKKMPKKEKPLAAVLAQKFRTADTSRTPEERDFEKKYVDVIWYQISEIQKQEEKNAQSALNKIFGDGDSCFKDFIKLQTICQPFDRQSVVPDSVVSEVEKMRIPFYAEYIKAKNAEIVAQIAAEKARGGYHLHQAGESEGDSLLVDLIKDFKGKVILIDFWNTWCMPCRQAIKQMEPMKEEFEGKDVVFMYIADESSPQETYDDMIVSMKGEHYRLTERQQESLMHKWGFTGIPSYVIIGKDGMVKDFHTGFQGVEYYKRKIEEDLENKSGMCHIEGTLSTTEFGNNVIICATDVDVRTSNNYITAKADNNGHFACDVDANQTAMYNVFLEEERSKGSWHFVNFLVENNATVTLEYNGDTWRVISGGEEQTKKIKMDAEVQRLYRAKMDEIRKKQEAELRPLADEIIKQGKNPTDDSVFVKRSREYSTQYEKLFYEYKAWELDYYKKNPMLYALYDIAEVMQQGNSGGRYDQMKTQQMDLYHTVFENFHPENPIHNTIRMHEVAWKLTPGKPYIDFEVSTVDGKRINIEPLYRGKVTLIDFWASWCGPCRKHSIALIPIYEKYKDKGFNVIAVAHEEKLSDMTRAAEQDAYPWQSYIDLNDQLKVWQKNGLGLGGGGMYLIDSNGIILSNSTDVEDLEPLIRQALGIK
ncbi:MAG: TlpA family protein disulfide reductase, partial [Bacteroidales bacterium]|nr:TlpA family protein disulfide reductase [Bacteroidales bacterium]